MADGETDPPETTLNTALINHFSSEITTIINNIVLFRMRSAFTVWIAPYLILGSYLIATDGKLTIELKDWDNSVIVGILVLLACYAILGAMAGAIEGRLWDRCDSLNSEIVRICNGNSENVAPSVSNKFDKSIYGYMMVFLALIVSFCAIVFLSQNIFVPQVTKAAAG